MMPLPQIFLMIFHYTHRLGPRSIVIREASDGNRSRTKYWVNLKKSFEREGEKIVENNQWQWHLWRSLVSKCSVLSHFCFLFYFIYTLYYLYSHIFFTLQFLCEHTMGSSLVFLCDS